MSKGFKHPEAFASEIRFILGMLLFVDAVLGGFAWIGDIELGELLRRLLIADGLLALVWGLGLWLEEEGEE